VSLPDPPVVTLAPAAATAATAAEPRLARVLTLAGFAAFTGYVYLMDPDKGGAYPLCPSKAIFGIDCPACGGLRGTNALLHGRIREALDHNLLLPLLLAIIAIGLGSWMLPLVGRPQRDLRLPRWLLVTLGVVIAAFTIARNLPGPRFDYLASDA
jgi:hypothetical protein